MQRSAKRGNFGIPGWWSYGFVSFRDYLLTISPQKCVPFVVGTDWN